MPKPFPINNALTFLIHTWIAHPYLVAEEPYWF